MERPSIPCYKCGTPAKQTCAACHRARYCSKQCQIGDWPVHQHLCEIPDNKGRERMVGSSFPGGGVSQKPTLVEGKRCCMTPWNVWGSERQNALYDPYEQRQKYNEILLGGGTYGDVYLFTNQIVPQEEYAVKVMRSDTDLTSVVAELAIRNLNHPNVIGTCKLTTFGGKQFAIFMDRANLDLYSYTSKMKNAYDAGDRSDAMFDDRKLAAFQVVNATAYTTSRLVLHCDIKPENYLIDGHPVSPNSGRTGTDAMIPKVMLTDFGLSLPFAENEPQSGILYSLWWRAPEVLFGSGRATAASEVWACGCVIYELLTFKGPFGQPQSEFEQATEIVKRIGVPTPQDIPAIDTYQQWKAWSSKLIAQYGVFDPNNNNFKTDLAEFPGAYELLSKMLNMTPEARPTIYEVVNDAFFASEPFRNKALVPGNARDFIYAHLPNSNVVDVPRFDFGKRFTPSSVVAVHRRAQRLPFPILRWSQAKKLAYTDIIKIICVGWKITGIPNKPIYPLMAIDIARKWLVSTSVGFAIFAQDELWGFVASFLEIATVYITRDSMSNMAFAILGTTWKSVNQYEQRIMIDIDFDVHRPSSENIASRLIDINKTEGIQGEYDVWYHFAIMMLMDIDFSRYMTCYDVAINAITVVAKAPIVLEDGKKVGLDQNTKQHIAKTADLYVDAMKQFNTISSSDILSIRNVCSGLGITLTV